MAIPVLNRPSRPRPLFLAVPKNLTATPGLGTVVLDWDDFAGATTYIVERRTAQVGPMPAGTWGVIVAGPIPSTYTDTTSTGLVPGTTYNYRVTATTATGTTGPSLSVTATPGDDYTLIANLVRDWDAAVGTFSDTPPTASQTADGGVVATWVDKIASDNASQVTAGNRPTLQTLEINSRPAIQFDKAFTQYLACATGATLAGGHSIFLVMTQVGGALTGTPLGDGASTKYFANLDVNAVRYNDGSGIAIPTHGPIPVDTWMIFETNRSTAPAWYPMLNGSMILPTTTGTTPETINVTGASTAVQRIGARQAGTIPFNGKIARILIYSRFLTQSEFERVRKLLAAQYAITLSVVPDAPVIDFWNTGQDEDGLGRLLVRWTLLPATPTQPAPTYYNVYAGTTSGSLSLVAQVSNEFRYFFYGQPLGVPLYVQVAAQNGVGEGPRSAELSVVPAALPASMVTSGLELAYDSNHIYQSVNDETVPAAAAGDPVNRWSDQSGNGRHALLAAGATAGVVRVNAADGVKAMECFTSVFSIAGPALSLTGDYTIFTVVGYPSQSATLMSLLAPPSGTTYLIGQTNNTTQTLVSGAPLPAFDALPELNIRVLLETQRQGTLWRWASNGKRWALDQTTPTGAMPVGFLGGRAGNAAPWRGQITALYIYNRVLTPTEHAQCRLYLENTFGTPGPGSYVLAGDHENDFQNQFSGGLVRLSSGEYLLNYMQSFGITPSITGKVTWRRSSTARDWHEKVLDFNDPLRDDNMGVNALSQFPSGRIHSPIYGSISDGSSTYRSGYLANTSNGDPGTWGTFQAITLPAGYTGMQAVSKAVYFSATDIRQLCYGVRAGFNELFLMKSVDGGVAWAFDRVVMPGTSALLSWTEATIVSLGGTNWLCVARSATVTSSLYFATSADDLATWTAPAVWSHTDGATQHATPAGLRMASGAVIMFWSERAPLQAVKGCKSTDNGANWGSSVIIWRPTSLGYPVPIEAPSAGKILLALTENRRVILLRGMTEGDFP